MISLQAHPNDSSDDITLMSDDCTFNNVIFKKFLYNVYMSLGNSFKKVTIHTYNENKSKMLYIIFFTS